MDDTMRDEATRWRSGDAWGGVGALAAGWSYHTQGEGRLSTLGASHRRSLFRILCALARVYTYLLTYLLTLYCSLYSSARLYDHTVLTHNY